jgi:ABC-type transport system substrate-binding protein
MLAGFIALTAVPTLGQVPRYGGRLTLRLREDLPQGFSLHETTTISSMWPAMPCFNNLLLFDPLKPVHSTDTIIGELAERWTWENQNRNLVFALRRGVPWHDGKPLPLCG